MVEVPVGFAPMRAYGALHELSGPFFWPRCGDIVAVGIRAAEKHCNAVGSVHGGMLITLADTALTLAASRASPKGNTR